MERAGGSLHPRGALRATAEEIDTGAHDESRRGRIVNA
jgi:hypothetical protein